MLKTLDLPVKPHVRKYLNTHLTPDVYVLSNSGRFGRMLFHLLRRQVKGRLHHAAAIEDCTAVLQLDLKNFPAHQYGLKEITDYTVFQFNDFVDETLKEELYVWMRQFLNRKTTIKEIIMDFMAAYDLREEEIQYETLRKAVQRNVNTKELKKKSSAKSVGKMSQKTVDLSRKTVDLSQKTVDLSREGQHRAVRQELMQLPSSFVELIRQQHGAPLQ